MIPLNKYKSKFNNLPFTSDTEILYVNAVRKCIKGNSKIILPFKGAKKVNLVGNILNPS